MLKFSRETVQCVPFVKLSKESLRAAPLCFVRLSPSALCKSILVVTTYGPACAAARHGPTPDLPSIWNTASSSLARLAVPHLTSVAYLSLQTARQSLPIDQRFVQL
jgi:hypothetical protein